jgi:hypothetical protein
MAWNDLLDNQMISFIDLQSSGFSLNPGQSHRATLTNQCITKSESLVKYNIKATNLSIYADNQLIPKTSNGIINIVPNSSIGCVRWSCDYRFHETDPGGQYYSCITGYNYPYAPDDYCCAEEIYGDCYTSGNGYHMWTTEGDFNFSSLLNAGETINESTTNVYVESVVYSDGSTYTITLGYERYFWTLYFGLASDPGLPQYAGIGLLMDDRFSFDVPKTDGMVRTLRVRGSIGTSTGRIIPISFDSTAGSPIGVAPSFLNTCDIPVSGNICGNWQSSSGAFSNVISGSVNFSSILQPGENILIDGFESSIRLSSYSIIGSTIGINIWESYGGVVLTSKYINNTYDFSTVRPDQENQGAPNFLPADKLKFTGIIKTSLGRTLYLSNVTSQYTSYTPSPDNYDIPGTSSNTTCPPILSLIIISTTPTNPNNQAGNNGTAVITFSGGVGPYTYTLNSVPQGAATPTFTINGLSASTTYTVQITDSINLTASTSFTLGNIVPLTNIIGNSSVVLNSVYFPLGGYYDMYACPVSTIVSSDFAGFETIGVTRYLQGNYDDIRKIKLFTPTVQTTNLIVDVSAEYLGIFSQSPYCRMYTRLVYMIAPTNATEYITVNRPRIEFPTAPKINYTGTDISPIYNSTYSVTIPNINVGETLYVFWEIANSNNYYYSNAYFQHKGFKITLKKFNP